MVGWNGHKKNDGDGEGNKWSITESCGGHLGYRAEKNCVVHPELGVSLWAEPLHPKENFSWEPAAMSCTNEQLIIPLSQDVLGTP